MSATQALVSVAQVAAGGTIVQAFVAVLRRRSELRQLDRQSDQVAVDTADHLIGMLRAELTDTKAEVTQLKSERDDLQRQITILGERMAAVRADLVIARAELDRLRR